MTILEPKSGLQFSMKTLMIVITIACLVLAMPGGFILLLVCAAWLVSTALIAKSLLIFRKPIYRILAGANK